MIKVSVVDTQPVFGDAIAALISNSDDIDVVSVHDNADKLILKMQNDLVHVCILILREQNNESLADIKILNHRFPKLKVLVIGVNLDENFIMHLIKVGAKGHLSCDTDRSEILEAIYTLRNGYEFYAKTIRNLLLNSYLNENSNKQKKKLINSLSPRETEVLRLFAEGRTNKQIADNLFISIRTVETHKTNIMKKINLKTTVDLVKFAIKNNIIVLD